MAKRFIPEDSQLIIQSLVKETDRSAMIIGTAWLEWGLETIIEHNLRKPENREEKSLLFSETGLFGSLSEKIDGAYFLKLIGQTTRQQCHIIRSLRNEVAHNMNAVTFESAHVINKCRELKVVDHMRSHVAKYGLDLPKDEEGAPEAKLRFITAISFLTLCLILRSEKSKMTEEEWGKKLVEAKGTTGEAVMTMAILDL